MSRIHFAIAAAAVAAVLVAVAPAGASQATLPKLVGADGPGFTITLKKAGKKVVKIRHGKYTITIKDLSSAHNFHLTGPGLNKTTTVSFQGTKTWTGHVSGRAPTSSSATRMRRSCTGRSRSS